MTMSGIGMLCDKWLGRYVKGSRGEYMKKITLFVSLMIVASVSSGYEDRASSQVKRHMLVALYQQIDMAKIISSIEGHALMPAIRDVKGWGEPEYRCIMKDVHGALKDIIFDALLNKVPSELIAENVMFYQTKFGQKVNAVVVHGKGLSGLNVDEQAKLKQNVAVLTFLHRLQTITQKTISDNMKPVLGPAILACTPEP